MDETSDSKKYVVNVVVIIILKNGDLSQSSSLLLAAIRIEKSTSVALLRNILNRLTIISDFNRPMSPQPCFMWIVLLKIRVIHVMYKPHVFHVVEIMRKYFSKSK